MLCGTPVMAQSERLQPKQPERAPTEAAPKTDPATTGLKGSPEDPGPALKGVALFASRDEVKAKGDVSAEGVLVEIGRAHV